ncbi:MAG: LacI family DNA-binding transcriptional regulator [Propionibacteriaceae bacterium]
MPAVRLSDVAERAGVSLATASRVINGSHRTPAEAIANRVRAAADELGYVANAQAQALARSATGLIGLVVHDIADPYFSTIISGAQRRARQHRSQVLLAGTERLEQAELDAVGAFASYRTDAIILAGSRGQHSDEALVRELERYIANGGRVVTFGRSVVPSARVVEVLNRDGARRLVTALVERGVRRFAVLGGPPDLVTTGDRVAGYTDGLAAAGLEPLLVVPGEFNSAGGYASALEVWQRLGEPDAQDTLCMLAVNDVMAQGAITAMRSLGLNVPRDVQVAGFDDIPTLRDYAPALTTFRLPLELIGERAAELALSSGETRPEPIQGEVVLRESAG